VKLFNIICAPMTFTRILNKVLTLYLNYFVIVYLINILVFSKTWEYHWKHLDKILSVLWIEKELINTKQHTFKHTKLVHIRFCKNQDWFNIALKKISAIANWPLLKKIHNLQSFMEMENYLKIFLVYFSDVTHPLNALKWPIQF